MIEMRRAQRSFGDGLIAEEVKDLREAGWSMPIGCSTTKLWWRRFTKRWQDDIRRAAAAVGVVRRPRWSCAFWCSSMCATGATQVLEREVRANLVYRDFTRVGGEKMPDAKTMGRWGLAVGPEVVKRVHERLVAIALDEGIATGRRMRVDTTVVETNIHYPTDSSLLGDGVRVLTRTMKKISRDRGRCRREIARPQPDREATRARHCPGRTRQGTAEPGAAQAELRQAARLDQPRGRPSQALRS